MIKKRTGAVQNEMEYEPTLVPALIPPKSPSMAEASYWIPRGTQWTGNTFHTAECPSCGVPSLKVYYTIGWIRLGLWFFMSLQGAWLLTQWLMLCLLRHMLGIILYGTNLGCVSRNIYKNVKDVPPFFPLWTLYRHERLLWRFGLGYHHVGHRSIRSLRL